MTKDEAITLKALKYAASLGYGGILREMKITPFTIKREEALAQPEQKPLAKVEPCAVCGEGKARLLVVRSCDTCHSEYAGQAEMKVALAQDEQSSSQEPVLLNGLTEAETNSSASVMGLTKHAQPEQEPVFLIYDDAGGWIESNESDYSKTEDVNRWLLYTTSPKRPWVGLMEEEIIEVDLYTMRTRGDGYAYARAIEAKLKEKNT